MRVVITGASGFIGNAVCHELVKRKVDVIRVSRHSIRNELPQQVIVDDYSDAPPGDVLIHLAETSNIAEIESIGDKYIADSTGQLEQLIKKNYQHIVYTSSGLVYGDMHSYPRRVKEDTISDNVYCRAKLACESLLSTVNGTCARLSSVYGVGMSPNNVISDVIAQLSDAGPMKLRDASPVRDFLWVEDAARGLADMATDFHSGIYNLGSGAGVSIKELAQAILGIFNQADREIISTMPGEKQSHLVLDISATNEAFGWSPRVSLTEGMQDLFGKK